MTGRINPETPAVAPAHRIPTGIRRIARRTPRSLRRDAIETAYGIAVRITDPRRRADALTGIALGVTEDDPACAERIVRNLDTPRRLLAYHALARRTGTRQIQRWTAHAEALIGQQPPPDGAAGVLIGLAALNLPARPRQANRLIEHALALPEDPQVWQREAAECARTAEAVQTLSPTSAAALLERADHIFHQHLTEPITIAELTGAAHTAATIVRTDPERATRLTREIENAVPAAPWDRTSPWRHPAAIATLALVTEDCEPRVTQRLVALAEHHISRLTRRGDRDLARARIAEALAAHHPLRARRLIGEIDETEQRIRAWTACIPAAGRAGSLHTAIYVDGAEQDALALKPAYYLRPQNRQQAAVAEHCREHLLAIAVATAPFSPARAELLAAAADDHAGYRADVLIAMADHIAAAYPGQARLWLAAAYAALDEPHADRDNHLRRLGLLAAAATGLMPLLAVTAARQIATHRATDIAPGTAALLAESVAAIDPELATTLTDHAQREPASQASTAQRHALARALIAITDTDWAHADPQRSKNLINRAQAAVAAASPDTALHTGSLVRRDLWTQLAENLATHRLTESLLIADQFDGADRDELLANIATRLTRHPDHPHSAAAKTRSRAARRPWQPAAPTATATTEP